MNVYVLSSIFVFCGLLSSTIGSDIDQCPKGVPRTRFLRTFKGQCYQFNNFERRWTDAQKYCSNNHGHLVVIKSAEEQNFIMSTLRKLHWNRNGVWIGATDRHKEMHWKWITGEPISYSNWGSGQPSCNWFCMEDCGQLRYRDGGKWHDYPCSSIPYLYSFICQYDGGQQHQMLEQEEDKAMPTGTTIALVLGILLGLMAGVCFGAVCFIRRRRKKPVEESSVGYANPYYGEAANQGPYSDDENTHIIDPACTMQNKESSYVHDESLPSVSLNNPTYGKLVMAIDEEYDLPKPSPCGASSDTYENSNPAEENFYEDIDSVKATIALNEAREQKEEEEEDRYVAMPTKGTV
ncbi:hypothetical protein SNE40_015349 [Patella caerulea]|uniref:C-type lectin domain-containing protein n=1 Tax=Patella caerulea TaxID=87958 RepID=A0AAN8JKY2_PATCE